MRIALGSDHAGFDLKRRIAEFLSRADLQVDDLGTFSTDSVDYPDVAERVALAVRDGRAERGILVCGSGIGVCITANKVAGIRAALASDPVAARLSRQHNDANVLCLPGRFLEEPAAEEVVRTWLETPFDGGRHEQRIAKITDLERRERRHA
jgi:ribose 5-phosphate isomerase B